MRSLRFLPIVGGVAAAAALSALAAAPALAADVQYSGSAYAVSVGATALGTLKADLPPVPDVRFPSGGKRSVLDAHDVHHQLLDVTVLNAASTSTAGVLTSTASVVKLNLLGGGSRRTWSNRVAPPGRRVSPVPRTS